MVGTDGEGVKPSTTSSGFDTRPPEGFTGGGYGQGTRDHLAPGYGWTPPRAPLPAGWQVDPQTRQILPPGTQPSGRPPNGLLPGYSWIAPGTSLPEGWHIDTETDMLVPPGDASGEPPAARIGGGGWHAPGSPEAGLDDSFDTAHDTAHDTAYDTREAAGAEAPEAPWPQTGPQPRVDDN